MRTIVLSDAHGEPDVIRGVLEHAGFQPGADRLVFAGDAIEVGRDSAGCLALLAQMGAEFLVGNHEYALFVDRALEAEPVEPEVEAAVAEGIGNGLWQLVAEADGVLISHAGISQLFAGEFETVVAARSLAQFVDGLNRQFRRAMMSPALETDGVCGPEGPLWYRPLRGVGPLSAVVQIAGHTPLELFDSSEDVEYLSAGGLHLIDPNVRAWRGEGFAPPAPLRYAVVEFGEVQVVCM